MVRNINEGDVYGTYSITDKKTINKHVFVTFHCNKCGKTHQKRLYERIRKLLQNSNDCICEEFDKHVVMKDSSEKDKRDWITLLRFNFNRKLKRKQKNNPDIPYNTLTEVLEYLGEKPQDTERFSYILYQDRKSQTMLKETFYWKKVLKSDVINAFASDNFSQNPLKRDSIRQKLAKIDLVNTSKSFEQLRDFVQTREHECHSLEWYINNYVGCTYNGFKVKGVSKHNSEIFFFVECSRCGKHLVKRKKAILANKTSCSCSFNAKLSCANTMNSAFYEKKYRSGFMFRDQITKALISEYTLFFGTPECIELLSELNYIEGAYEYL